MYENLSEASARGTRLWIAVVPNVLKNAAFVGETLPSANRWASLALMAVITRCPLPSIAAVPLLIW